jgi:hypothetical protein
MRWAATGTDEIDEVLRARQALHPHAGDQGVG